MNHWLRFSLAVVATSAALVVALVATGALLVGNALASGVQHGQGFTPGMAFAGGPAHQALQGLPPELASLKDVPAAERFAHFKGVQIHLTDKDGKPISIAVTPGVATSVSSGSLSIQGNDGTSHSYVLTDQTMIRDQTVTTGENVVVVTLDNTSTARAVFGANPGDWRHR